MHMSAQNTAPTRQAGWPASFLVPGPLSAPVLPVSDAAERSRKSVDTFQASLGGLIGGL